MRGLQFRKRSYEIAIGCAAPVQGTLAPPGRLNSYMRVLSRRVPAAVLAAALLGSAGCELMVAGRPRFSASDTWERTYDLGDSPSVSIANTNGAVTVEGHDGTRVEVRAERTVKAGSEEGARQLLSATTIAEEVDGTSLSLTTTRPSSFSIGQQAEVRYDVRVPRNASLTLRTTNGSLTIEAVRGVVDLETVNGRVRGSALGQVRRAETVNGSVDLTLDRVPAEGARFETVNGSVELTFPAGLAANLTVRTVNGRISVDGFTDVDEDEDRRRRFDGRLNGGGPSLSIETVNGSVTVRGRSTPTT